MRDCGAADDIHILLSRASKIEDPCVPAAEPNVSLVSNEKESVWKGLPYCYIMYLAPVIVLEMW